MTGTGGAFWPSLVNWRCDPHVEICRDQNTLSGVLILSRTSVKCHLLNFLVLDWNACFCPCNETYSISGRYSMSLIPVLIWPKIIEKLQSFQNRDFYSNFANLKPRSIHMPPPRSAWKKKSIQYQTVGEHVKHFWAIFYFPSDMVTISYPSIPITTSPGLNWETI